MAELEVVILAAGQGTRMRSSRPKVLHEIGGRPMLAHVIDASQALSPARIHVVHGHGAEQVREAFSAAEVDWVLQAEQHGTGHAVREAMPGVAAGAVVLVLYGDVPLVNVDTLSLACELAERDTLAVVTARMEDPSGYGRILRDDSGDIRGIREQKDASAAELLIDEVNTGIMAAPGDRLRTWLAGLTADNAQGELYLTDCVFAALADGVAVRAVQAADVDEITGVNDRSQLAALERAYQRREAERLMRGGVTVADPARLDVRGRVSAGEDVYIDVNVVLEGDVTIGAGSRIGPNCVIRDSHIGAGVQINASSIIEEARVGDAARVGPFARLRPQADLGHAVHVGNFVEVKNSTLHDGAKVNHLSYVGDSEVGARVNVGAGTITCNYDGANKHRTVIGADAFIGSGTQLVAPVEVGEGATIGAGSTISRDAPAGELTLSRAVQTTVKGWKRPVKKPR